MHLGFPNPAECNQVTPGEHRGVGLGWRRTSTPIRPVDLTAPVRLGSLRMTQSGAVQLRWWTVKQRKDFKKGMLSSVRHTLGSLDKVVRLAKVLGMVNCTPDFTNQPQVINGFSELMVRVFGEYTGKGARSAVGVCALPSNIAVEIEAIFEVRG